MNIKFKKIIILGILCFTLVNSVACAKISDKTEISLEKQEELYLDLVTDKLSIVGSDLAELVEILKEEVLTPEEEKRAKELINEVKITAQSYLDIKKSDIPIKYEIADIYMDRAMKNYIEAMNSQPLKKEDMTLDNLLKSSESLKAGNENLTKFIEELDKQMKNK